VRGLYHASWGRAGRRTAGLLVLLLVAGLAPAAPAAEGDALGLGLGLLEESRFEEARPLLEQAVAERPGSGAAQLALGMCELGLERPDEAIVWFERARRTDPGLEQIALYDIGLAHRRAGRPGEAREALERSVAVDEDSRLATSARELLDLIEPPEKRWSLAARLGVEFDDNVTVSEVDVTSDQADVAFVAEASGSYRLLQSERYELEGGYDFFQSLHADVSDADFQSHGLWLEGSRAGRSFDTSLGYRFTTTTLGGDGFLSLHEVAPRVAIEPTSWWLAEPTLGFTYKDFADDSDRDAAPDRPGYALAGYRFEAEDARGAEFDWMGFSLRTGLHVPFELARGSNALDLSYRFRLRRYANDTPSIDERRFDHVHSVGVGLTRELARSVDARLDYRFVGSVSNLPEADYLENILTFSVGVSL
jgi:hypothetical protein